MAGQATFASLDDYINRRRAQYGGDIWHGKIRDDISARWDSRVLPNGWHRKGELGADFYLQKYGRGIKAPKVIHLALWAEKEGYPDMARGFWKKALQLEGVQIGAGTPTPQPATPPVQKKAAPQKPSQPDPDPVGSFFGAEKNRTAAAKSSPATSSAPPAPPFEPIRYLPDHLQPASLSVMKPVKSPLKVQALIESDDFVAFPDRPVQRVIIGQGQGWEFFQGENGENLGPIPSFFRGGFNSARIVHGEFIVEGELFYRDSAGGIHPTAKAAETANGKLGRSAPVFPCFSAIRALTTKHGDLTGADEGARLETGAKIARVLAKFDEDTFEMPTPASTPEEKAALSAQGKTIWLRKSAGYKDPAGVYNT